MKLLSLNRLFLVLTLFCSLGLLMSFLAQFAFHHEPCFLCNLQRFAFAATGGLALTGFFSENKTLLITCLIVILTVSFLISGYHCLIQFEIIHDFCIKHSPISESAFDAILNTSSKSPKGCSSKSWGILGLPASFYNMCFFLTSALFVLQRKSLLQRQRSTHFIENKRYPK